MNSKDVKIIVGVSLLVMALTYYSEIHRYAYMSYASSCYDLTDDEISERGYVVVGQTKLEVNNDTGKTLPVIKIIDFSPDVVRHEKIHQIQFLDNRTWNCKSPFFRYSNEVEAYIMQRFSDNFLNKFYGTTIFTC